MYVKSISALLAGAAALSITGCAVGPDYEKPSAPQPAAYKEQAGWKPSEPQDTIERGSWWSIYKDPVLDGLEKRIDISNQTLKASEAAYRQARAAVDAARAGYLPTITASGSGTRSHSGRGSTGSTTFTTTSNGTANGTNFSTGGSTYNSYSASLGASWEPDIWGKISRTVEGDIATAQASAADLAAARLSAQATMAIDYFELRYQDELKRLLERTVSDYQRSLQITQNQYNVGVAAKADVLSAQTQLMNAQTSLINTGVARATLEHAIAVLAGEAPGNMSIDPGPLSTDVPVVPTGLPSTLLERRPDIAAAERQMAAANAQVGVAIAAYFPTISLSASDGFSGTRLAHLISSPNNVWSLGANLAGTIFDAGLRSAQVEQARATFDQNVANYRQTVLTGFQQVEDELATLRILEQQSLVETQVVKTAQEATRLTLNQYKSGIVPYSSVISAQATELSTEETALNVIQNRLVASATLIEAVGGGWDAAQLPGVNEVEDDTSFLHVIPITSDHPTASQPQ
jgi:NodT family efflux transporter outer membrane factor (OMF) lipoprotein